MSKPKPKLPTPKPKIGERDPKHRRTPAKRDGEPKTPEGRARRKLQFGSRYQIGCVLSYTEMQTVIAALPEGWLDKETL